MFRMTPQGVDALSECLSKAPLWENRLFMSMTFVVLVWLFAMAGLAGKDDKKRFGLADIINLLVMVFLLVVVALLLAYPWSC
jgi:hypothetical protein